MTHENHTENEQPTDVHQRLLAAHAAMVAHVTGFLDTQAGLDEVRLAAEHAALVRDTPAVLDVEAGLAEIQARPKRASSSQPSDRTAPPGQFAEMATVDELLSRAREGRTGSLVITGEDPPHAPEGVVTVNELIPIVNGLVDGDWRSAIRQFLSGRRLGGPREVTELVVCLVEIALNMRAQCADADAAAAWSHLETAAEILHGRRTRATGVVGQLRDRIERLLTRELAELQALQLAFARSPRGQQELVHAYVEYLTWVRMDPFTVANPPDDQQMLGLNDDEYALFGPARRTDMCARASRLRYFAGERGGSLSEKNWDRAGRERGVEKLALLTLAEEPLQRGHDLPVRQGRYLAWSYARGLSEVQHRSNVLTDAG